MCLCEFTHNLAKSSKVTCEKIILAKLQVLGKFDKKSHLQTLGWEGMSLDYSTATFSLKKQLYNAVINF